MGKLSKKIMIDYNQLTKVMHVENNKNLPHLMNSRESASISYTQLKQRILKHIYTHENFLPIQRILVKSTINYIDIDTTRKFVITSDSNGYASIYKFSDHSKGTLELFDKIQLQHLTLHKSQWYPSDNGMFCMTYPDRVVIVDTNTLKAIDTFSFPSKKIYGTDWNALNPCLVAVGLTSSALGFIDIRTGSSVQQITVESLLGLSNHSISSVIWSRLDDECIFAGDSSGYIHIFDIRKPRKSLQTVGSDSTTCEQVVTLAFTPDNGNLISVHGINNRLTQWTFQKNRLVNTNINYPSFYSRANIQKRPKMISSFLKCQLYITDSLLFKPPISGSGSNVCIHNLKDGERIGSLTSPHWCPDDSTFTNCVNGLYHDYPILLVGGKRLLTVWGPFCKPDEVKHPLHQDDWSD